MPLKSTSNLRLMQLTIEDAEIRALIRLLDDPDTDVYENVSDRLVSFGKNVIPLLETEWEIQHQRSIQNRIETIIDEIEFYDCCQSLQDWCEEGAENLLEGVLAASRFQYPEIDKDFIIKTIERIRKDVWIELNDNLTSLEKARVINHILFDVHHFKALNKFQNSYQSYYLSNLVESKAGSPISLAILYKLIADSLELPIVGLNLPGHFILGYSDVFNHTENDMLFYINPFSNGAVFGRGELERFIERTELKIHISELKPMSNIQIVKRMLQEISSCYQRHGKYRKLDQANELIEVLKWSNKK